MDTLNEISEELLSCNSNDLPESMVGAAILVSKKGFAKHAAIFVRYRGYSKILHYTGSEILFQDIETASIKNSVYLFAYLNIIPTNILASFFNNCTKAVGYTNAVYGYYIEPNTHFTDEGELKSETEFPPFMTCVGFCVYFLRRFLTQDLFFYDDWNASTIIDAPDDTLQPFFDEIEMSIPSIKFDVFKKNIRRIKPIEYLAGAYSKRIPIRKRYTDKMTAKLSKILEERVAV